MNTHPNILLLVLDSVRARNTSIHGHRNDTTPFLLDFAGESTVYSQARAPSIHSVASHASLFNGYHVEEHGVTEHESRLDPAATVWHRLETEFGYRTGIFSPNLVVMETSNLSEPFGTRVGLKRSLDRRLYDAGLSPSDFDDHVSAGEYLRASLRNGQPVRSVLNGLYYRYGSHADSAHDPETESASVYLDHFLEWAEERSGPWAACVNLMDAHYPYVPREEHDRWGGPNLRRIQEDITGTQSRQFLTGRPWGELAALESLYDGCIHQIDAALRSFVRDLKEAGLYEDTLLVITSDHGEGFGERSLVTPRVRHVDHSWGIGEELTHVPLVVKAPNQHRGRRVDAPVSLTDFRAVAEGYVEGYADGDPFSDLGRDEVVASTFRVPAPGDVLPDSVERADYVGPWRAVYQANDGVVYKYVTHGPDRATVRILDAQTAYRAERDEPGIVDEIFGRMENREVADGSRDLTRDVEAQLEDLGYMR
ncbi:sulfatase-like hydrolase/transferase [Halomarina halobia]|uniref:Sulfatase-like hydrolase/transferase n=1 Tax=Halomarina halobia TaxID=3033386 RepID=A0ABD6A8K7_9EURY|nr:sulfatase-like hydrolase/transferase [Halomarina sp. PSR21]